MVTLPHGLIVKMCTLNTALRSKVKLECYLPTSVGRVNTHPTEFGVTHLLRRSQLSLSPYYDFNYAEHVSP